MGRYTKPKNKLKELYGCIDMLTLAEHDILDFHHIIKKYYGGPDSATNGALLEEETHIWLHILEERDPELYELINECLTYYKVCLELKEKRALKVYRNEVVPILIMLVEDSKIERANKSLVKKINSVS